MAKQRVSKSFNTFLQKKAKGLEEAVNAENTLSSINFPVGTRGTAVIVDMVADVSKNGNYYVNVVVSVLTPKAGVKMTKNYTFSESEKYPAEVKYGWFLNDLENIGMDRDYRVENGKDMNKLVEWALDGEEPRKVTFEIVEQGTGKRINLYQFEEDGAPASEIECVDSADKIEVGCFVSYNGVPQEVISFDAEAGVVTMKSKTTGQTKSMSIDKLDLA